MTVQATCNGWISALVCVYIYYTMQYEISGSVLAGQITTTTWAGAPSRTWAWSRAIGGAGQFASWTRAAQLRTSTWAKAAVARATVPPRRSTLRWTCPGRALGEGSGRSGLGAPWTRAAQLATSAWAVACRAHREVRGDSDVLVLPREHISSHHRRFQGVRPGDPELRMLAAAGCCADQ